MRFDSLGVTKLLIKQPDTWVEFYVQDPNTKSRTGDRYARNRANIYRTYVKRKGFPVDIKSQRHADGLIHCWGRWNEGGNTSAPSTGL